MECCSTTALPAGSLVSVTTVASAVEGSSTQPGTADVPNAASGASCTDVASNEAATAGVRHAVPLTLPPERMQYTLMHVKGH